MNSSVVAWKNLAAQTLSLTLPCVRQIARTALPQSREAAAPPILRTHTHLSSRAEEISGLACVEWMEHLRSRHRGRVVRTQGSVSEKVCADSFFHATTPEFIDVNLFKYDTYIFHSNMKWILHKFLNKYDKMRIWIRNSMNEDWRHMSIDSNTFSCFLTKFRSYHYYNENNYYYHYFIST